MSETAALKPVQSWLQGPCLSVNTACSSSLVALDSAVAALLGGCCAGALVGGVCLQLHPAGWAAMCALRALAPDGQCKTFDGLANGYGRSDPILQNQQRD